MKSLKQHIYEKLILNKNIKVKEYNYHPKTKEELQKIIKQLVAERGYEADLNDIDTSEITDMSRLFTYSDFNGDISEWDVSKVTDMYHMFKHCRYFNKPLNDWDVSKVKDLSGMFDMATQFDQPLNNWKLSNAIVMVDMFHSAYQFKQDLSSWDLRHITVSQRRGMFTMSKMIKKYLPRFK